MITLPELYDHQTEHKDRVRSALAKHGRVICNAPTGCGKTRMSKWILGSSAMRKKLANQSGYSLFAVHRRGLVDNACDSFSELPELPHGTIMAGRETTLGRRIQVGSIDTLIPSLRAAFTVRRATNKSSKRRTGCPAFFIKSHGSIF